MDVTAQFAGWRMADVESHIRGLQIETACVFAPSGELVFAEQGSTHELVFTDAQVQQMDGNVLTHNHPAAVDSFSFEDVSIAWEGSLNELRMVNAHYTFSLTGIPGSYGWWEVDELIRALMPQVIEDRDQGLVDGAAMFHALWQRVAERLGLTYTRAQEAQ